MKINVIDRENKQAGEIEIDDSLIKKEVKDDLIHDVVLAHLANSHTNSSNAKTRAEVAGGGRKPYRQKGTGSARHGSNRSPIWKGGGVTFGPRPVKKRIQVNKAGKKKAFAAVLGSKIGANDFVVVDDFGVTEPKTKTMKDVLKNLSLDKKKVLIVVPDVKCPVVKSARNIKNAGVTTAADLNVYDLLIYPKVVATKGAMEKIVKRLG